jgi:hypothetical protein
MTTKTLTKDEMQAINFMGALNDYQDQIEELDLSEGIPVNLQQAWEYAANVCELKPGVDFQGVFDHCEQAYLVGNQLISQNENNYWVIDKVSDYEKYDLLDEVGML